MPRAKYLITVDDLNHARSYLEHQLRVFGIELRDDVTYSRAERQLADATKTGTKNDRAEQLNSWCELHLPSKEWGKLKTAIRKRRQRSVRHTELKSITISARAHQCLSKLAERDGVTFSEVLERHLGHAVKKRPASR